MSCWKYKLLLCKVKQQKKKLYLQNIYVFCYFVRFSSCVHCAFLELFFFHFTRSVLVFYYNFYTFISVKRDKFKFFAIFSRIPILLLFNFWTQTGNVYASIEKTIDKVKYFFVYLSEKKKRVKIQTFFTVMMWIHVRKMGPHNIYIHI